MTKAEAGQDLLRPPAWWRYALVVLAALLLLLLAMWVLRQEYRGSEDARAQAVQSYDRRLALVSLLSRIKDAETAQRGYLLTGDRAFLASYGPARREIARSATSLPALFADVAGEVEEVSAQQALVKAKLAELDRTIALVDSGEQRAAFRMVGSGEGRRYMEALQASIGGMIAREAARLDSRRAAVVSQGQGLARTMLITLAACMGLLLVFAVMYWRVRRERHGALVKAFEAARRHAVVLDSTTDAILILNPSGTIEMMNAAATTMLGYSAEEIGRRDVSTLIDIAPGEGSFHHRVGLEDGRLRRTVLSERHVRRRDGSEVPVDVALGVMKVPSGTHLVVSLRDVSERTEIERAKDDLMATVSHELRTPLTSVVGALGLLRAGTTGRLAPDTERLVEIAENNSRRLIRLINDMLDIDRIEAGKLCMAREPVDLASVLDQACVASEGLARTSGVHLLCRTPDATLLVSGDADRLIQVTANLVANAIRVSARGDAVEISVERLADGRVQLAVDDYGPGVPPEFRSRIFGRFERAGREDGSTGTGLGLAISREIVSRHGGEIWFEDRPGGGSRFAFALPQAARQIAEPDALPQVLVASANIEITERLGLIAAAEGCGHVVAEDAAAMTAAVARRDFAAVLLDLHLPGGGGLVLARRLRAADPPFAGPIVVVSHGATAEDALSTLDVVDCVAWPDEAQRLTEALRLAIGRVDTARPTILHVDDDRDLLSVVAAHLEPDVRIVTANDLAAARVILESMSPDAVILDMQLAQGSGLELLPFLVDAKGVAIPTIIYSAQDMTAEIVDQVDAVLVKARGSLPDLKVTLRRVLGQRGGVRT